ncbi:MAG: glucosaminidase domain-containing protein [Marinilabiliaceae bacterium]|nr:glucosaminidase domain-containing protein [Marinilabiliaceae bacterium]
MIRKKTILRAFLLIIFGIFCGNYANGQKKISRKDYIDTYKDWAIKDMPKSGIPVSIKLAQAILESGDGNSELARKSNNHFGIKCHNDWTGKRVYHDDDAKGECFRAYKNPLDSFEDHTIFLTTRSRYQKLFDLNPTDYRAWAKGLKECGYATNPKYAELLIKIIEENELYKYDTDGGKDLRKRKPSSTKKEKGIVVNPFSAREVKYNNGVKYIEVQRGDTYQSLTNELKFKEWQLSNYNDIPTNADISEFRYLYIESKRNNAHPSNNFHTVKEGDTMHSISHKYGMKLNKLYKFNSMEKVDELNTGQRINLRKKSK